MILLEACIGKPSSIPEFSYVPKLNVSIMQTISLSLQQKGKTKPC